MFTLLKMITNVLFYMFFGLKNYLPLTAKLRSCKINAVPPKNLPPLYSVAQQQSSSSSTSSNNSNQKSMTLNTICNFYRLLNMKMTLVFTSVRSRKYKYMFPNVGSTKFLVVIEILEKKE